MIPKKLQDIKSPQDEKYAYVKGRKFRSSGSVYSFLKIFGIGFLIISAINLVNIYHSGKDLETNITNTAHHGLDSLVDAGRSMNFEEAIRVFQQAEKDLWFINKDNSVYFGEANLGQSVKSGFAAGTHIATAGQYLSHGWQIFKSIPQAFSLNNSIPAEDPVSISEMVRDGLAEVEMAISEINQASDEIAQINEKSLPIDQKQEVIHAKEQISQVTALLNKTADHFPAIIKLLGDRYPHRYLILLQNNNEVRPTGGFIGSYMIIDINDGFIDKFETYDVYDIDGSYTGYIKPPEELLTFTSNWRLRDSNYSPDFPTSAAKAAWFLQKEGGPTVDTVISVNQSVLQDLLEITGPIQVGDFGKLDSENYTLLLSYIIEAKAWGEKNPKHILKSFIPAFKEHILQEDNITKISSTIFKAIQQKQIMLFSHHDDIQALFDAFNLSGRTYQLPPDQDYLSIVNISVGGNKSDQFLEESIHHDTHVSADGTLTNTITLTHTHQWSQKILDEWLKTLREYGITSISEEVLYILGQGTNRRYTRIYVPKGSILLNSSDHKLTQKYDPDTGKSYFFTKIEVDPGQSNTLQITYVLPHKLDLDDVSTYKLTAQKQPGSIGSIFTKSLSYDSSLTPLTSYPEEAFMEPDGSIKYATNLTYDRYFSSLIKEK